MTLDTHYTIVGHLQLRVKWYIVLAEWRCKGRLPHVLEYLDLYKLDMEPNHDVLCRMSDLIYSKSSGSAVEHGLGPHGNEHF